MKKLIFTSTFLLALFFSNNTFAKIWRVNNTSGVVADFTSPQSAHDAASAGDTIHIEPGASAYAALTISKPIVLIGNGYFLDQAPQDTGLQVNTNGSFLSSITFSTGSSGTTVQGITAYYFYLQASNILLRRNYVIYWVYLYANANNLTIIDNYLNYGFSAQSSPITGLYIGNNIIASCNVGFPVDYTGTFENNDCYGGSVSMYNFQVDNNILWSTSYTNNNCVPFNNIGNSTQFPATNGNLQNVNMNNTFVNSGSTDGAWMLAAGSPAFGAGYNGVDCGITGGPNPYKLAGIPNVPTIYKYVVPPTGTSTLSVTISTKSNN